MLNREEKKKKIDLTKMSVKDGVKFIKDEGTSIFNSKSKQFSRNLVNMLEKLDE